jgi:hypothetical protein
MKPKAHTRFITLGILTKELNCVISGSHGSVYEYGCLLGCSAVQSGRSLQTSVFGSFLILAYVIKCWLAHFKMPRHKEKLRNGKFYNAIAWFLYFNKHIVYTSLIRLWLFKCLCDT